MLHSMLKELRYWINVHNIFMSVIYVLIYDCHNYFQGKLPRLKLVLIIARVIKSPETNPIASSQVLLVVDGS